MPAKQAHDDQHGHVDDVLDDPDKLLKVSAVQNILMAFGKEGDQHLAQDKDDHQAAVDDSGIRIARAKTYPVSQAKAELQHNKIQDQEIPVLEPTL